MLVKNVCYYLHYNHLQQLLRCILLSYQISLFIIKLFIYLSIDQQSCNMKQQIVGYSATILYKKKKIPICCFIYGDTKPSEQFMLSFIGTFYYKISSTK